ncbi:MAG: hypothetical protein GY679_01945 [Mycoplasma sp.]|nr:hypothetical protein [Mycoplasma sp.]
MNINAIIKLTNKYRDYWNCCSKEMEKYGGTGDFRYSLAKRDRDIYEEIIDNLMKITKREEANERL